MQSARACTVEAVDHDSKVVGMINQPSFLVDQAPPAQNNSNSYLSRSWTPVQSQRNSDCIKASDNAAVAIPVLAKNALIKKLVAAESVSVKDNHQKRSAFICNQWESLLKCQGQLC